MKISTYLSANRLVVLAEDGSIAELDRLPNLQEDCKLENGNWFWFARLKAKREGEGVGTLLMQELVKACDENRIDIFCTLNPYGRLNRDQLRAFYLKFGLVDKTVDGHHAMIRRSKSVTM